MTDADARRPLPEDALYDETHAPEDGVAERFVEAMSSLAAAVSVIAVTSPRSGRAGLTATAMSGAGWNCILGSLTCTRSNALAGNTSYPSITLTVNVSANAPGFLTNVATVSGGGDGNTTDNTASDVTIIWSSR